MKEERPVTHFVNETILITHLRPLINQCYREICSTLLSTDSYENGVTTDNAQTYLKYLNEGIKGDFSKITQILYYIVDPDRNMCETTYPFEFLRKSAKQEIELLFYIAKWIHEGCLDDLNVVI